MNQGGQAEFLLKFLYIADALTPKMEAKHTTILQGLIDQGILREKDGSITFYHDKVRSSLEIPLYFPKRIMQTFSLTLIPMKPQKLSAHWSRSDICEMALPFWRTSLP